MHSFFKIEIQVTHTECNNNSIKKSLKKENFKKTIVNPLIIIVDFSLGITECINISSFEIR